ncbi:UvrD-helicase domain-containing protein [Thermoflexibacter ruber]|uniref:DNA 3'-5' helicase II n=1 Tax=Thermoflexibacter ruber TaxID=1003 RepID=A0A1I2J3E9_9BACT|nr:UvrD-helicase domain-containing protein [Thermoflexibacter ruber]SFF47456.1 DNA helicase-2 / ATP-dependent DNA helicase PcrA [Thermoflexibacter ruber]
MKTEKPTLVIAGAGSGKTTNMVKEILKYLPELEPHRFLAAITYTNAATNSIRERLSQYTKIPANVFVGTTYAFFNKFLVLPYGSLLPKVTEDKKDKKENTIKEYFIATDKIFFELDDKKVLEILTGRHPDWNRKNAQQKQVLEYAFTNQLVRQGKIPFDKIASIASYLICDYQIVREKVGSRLQFLFVDEFQDTDNQQFKVFDEIRKSKKTKIYKVGDAEQFISNYSAGFKDFSKIPILQHKQKYEVEEKRDNNRCSSQITTFINNFNTQLQQEARFSTVEKNGVFFISQTDLLQISNTFKDKTEIWRDEPDFKRFYLAFENKAFDSVSGLIKISNESKKSYHLLSEVILIITKIVGFNSKQICEKYNINIIQLRTLAIKLWKKEFANFDEFKTYFERDLAFQISTEKHFDAEKFFSELQNLKIIPKNQQHTDYTTTIHKSKGLEATCVLVVARDNNELEKWLENNHTNRVAVQYNQKNKKKAFEDHYRLGFVAFSRAKMALYIACLQQINEANKKKLESLNVQFV